MKTTHSLPNNNDYAKKLIGVIELEYEATFKPKSIELWANELKILSIDDLNKAYKAFKSKYDSLPYRFSVSIALKNQLKPTITTASVEERLNTSLKADDPWQFLARIDPKLKQLADASNMFDKGMSSRDLSYCVTKVAKQYCEWGENKQKGFTQEEPTNKAIETHSKQILKGVKNPYAHLGIKAGAIQARKDLEAKEKEGK